MRSLNFEELVPNYSVVGSNLAGYLLGMGVGVADLDLANLAGYMAVDIFAVGVGIALVEVGITLVEVGIVLFEVDTAPAGVDIDLVGVADTGLVGVVDMDLDQVDMEVPDCNPGLLDNLRVPDKGDYRILDAV